MARQEDANTILNDVALEVGLLPVTDPWSSSDDAFIQLQGLLNSAGREMCDLHDWTILKTPFAITTASTDTGNYPLPDDFSRMMDQTGWDRLNTVPVGGPLSSQDWAWLEGRDLVSSSIYASFRLADNIIQIYPQPPPDGLQITFEYISRNWVMEQGGTKQRKDRIGQGTDIVLYEPIMMVKFLKVKFLSAKGFDITNAARELDLMFDARTGMDTGATILNAGSSGRNFPYLNPYGNTPDTGFGSY